MNTYTEKKLLNKAIEILELIEYAEKRNQVREGNIKMWNMGSFYRVDLVREDIETTKRAIKRLERSYKAIVYQLKK